jgi:hypothetical protein
MRRIHVECAVVALVVWGAYRWTHRPPPPPARLFSGARPDLDMPGALALRPEKPADAMLVVPEGAGASAPRLRGSSAPARPVALGSTPRLLSGPRGAAPAEEAPALAASRPGYERLRGPGAVAAAAALFVVLYALLASSLRRGDDGRGPGGRGLTHD